MPNAAWPKGEDYQIVLVDYVNKWRWFLPLTFWAEDEGCATVDPRRRVTAQGSHDAYRPCCCCNCRRGHDLVTKYVDLAYAVTPLDVVKTRLQTQNTTAYADVSAQEGASVRSGAAPKTDSALRPGPAALPLSVQAEQRVPPTVALTGHAHGACLYPKSSGAALTNPESVFKDRRMTGIWDGIAKVARTEGWRGLWRGLVPTVAMTVPSQVTYMTCYDIFRRMILPSDPLPAPVVYEEVDSYVPDFPCDMPCEHAEDALPPVTAPPALRLPVLGASLVSGALSRCVSATLVTPLELVRTRLQASQGAASVWRPVLEEVRQNGLLVLWRGLPATLWRDVPFSAIYFTGYEAGKHMLTGAGFGESQASTFWREFGISFTVGATSGSIAALVTHPFDLVKTRLQAETFRTATYPPNAARASMAQALRTIIASDGAVGLFRGLSPRLAKVAPSCGIMIASFEVVGRFLANAHPDP